MDDIVRDSRLKNVKRNVLSGALKQSITIFLNFFVRTTVIYTLSAEYQGLGDLFTSVLHILNLSDFGFSTAVTFILYKPIAENDIDTICAIMNFLKKIYTIIGCMILGIGLVIAPFLTSIISGHVPDNINIYVLFFIYLFNAAISYLLFAYKSTLLTAMQREDIVSNVYTLTQASIKIIQIILLFIFHNYYTYVLLLLVGNICNNIFLHICAKKAFPKIIPVGNITRDMQKELIQHVKAVFINRICDIARNSLDNIILSAFVGLIAVAVYDNYYYVYTALYGTMGIIVHAIKASVGNSIIKETNKKNYNDMQRFTFMFMWLVGWCFICMLCLYQPFMYIWMDHNTKLLFPMTDVFLFCLYFYTISMTYTQGVYLEAKGLFKECRKYYIMEAIGNLVLNIILCYFFGTTGILVATILTIFFFNFLGGTNVLFRYYFEDGKIDFFGYHIFYFIITMINAYFTYKLSEFVNINGIVGLIMKTAICIIVPNIIYFLSYFKIRYFKESKKIIVRFCQK